MVTGELEREAERRGESALNLRRAALAVHTEEMCGKHTDHFTDNQHFIDETKTVLDIMSGLTVAKQEQKQAIYELGKLLVAVACVMVLFGCMRYANPVDQGDSSVTCSEQHYGGKIGPLFCLIVAL